MISYRGRNVGGCIEPGAKRVTVTGGETSEDVPRTSPSRPRRLLR